jgi:integrase
VRSIHRLTDHKVSKLLKSGTRRRHADGGGLYLQCNGKGQGSWVFVSKRSGKESAVGLGSIAAVSLDAAREQAERLRQAAHEGNSLKAVVARSHGKTFEDAARALIADLAPSWKDPSTRKGWHSQLLGEVIDADSNVKGKAKPDYCAALRPMSVDAITTEHILNVLRPIWHTKHRAAERLRSRIERSIGHAIAVDWRPFDKGNPASWNDRIKYVLPAPPDATEHHRAIPYTEIQVLMHALRPCETVAARALEFTILIAGRGKETRLLKWDEVYLDSEEIRIPAPRMKKKRRHIVPLSARAIEILREMQAFGAQGYVFPSRRRKPLSEMAFTQLLKRLDFWDVTTAHGLRSTFRDWAGDQTDFAKEVVEFCLAHKVKDESEAAYRRTTAVEKRRELMRLWGVYCTAQTPTPDRRSHDIARKQRARGRQHLRLVGAR